MLLPALNSHDCALTSLSALRSMDVARFGAARVRVETKWLSAEVNLSVKTPEAADVFSANVRAPRTSHDEKTSQANR